MTIFTRFFAVRLFAVLMMPASAALAQEDDQEPPDGLLRLGIGVAGQVLPYYRGAHGHESALLPFPYVEYYGEILKADENGVRAELFRSPRLEAGFSGDLSLRLSPDDQGLREGMPELGSELQAGPSLNVLLAGSSFRSGLILRLPVRAVFIVDELTSVEPEGMVFNPMLSYVNDDIGHHWRASANIGLFYGDSTWHRYYYAVDDRYASGQRPAYGVGSGYSGHFLEFGLSRKEGKMRYSLELRYDNLSDAVFSDSPLVETDEYWVFGFSIARVLGEVRPRRLFGR